MEEIEDVKVARIIAAVKGGAERGLEIGVDFDIVDHGDAALEETSGDDDRIRDAIGALARAGAAPVALGGDHAVTFPIIEALSAVHGPLDILHIHAHPDLYDELDGNRRSHASPFARIMENGLAKRLVQVGVRTMNAVQRRQAERFCVEVVEMRRSGDWRRPSFAGPLYVSLDLDGLDPAFAPGVSHYEPGGLNPRQVVNWLLELDAVFVGGDIVELNPDRDVQGMTAQVAAKFAREMLALSVERGR
jgi:arginase